MDDENVIALIGPATLAEAPRLREELREGLTRASRLRVDLRAAGPWDVVGLQLLIATAASANREGATVQFFNVPANCLAVIDRAALGDWFDRFREPTIELP